MIRVFLTGASGYIGKHITLQLLNQGYEVRASVRKLSKSSEVRDAVAPHLLDSSKLVSRLTFIELDLEKDSDWDSALNGIDVLMHTASPFPLTSPKDENELTRPTVEGTIRARRPNFLLAQCGQPRRYCLMLSPRCRRYQSAQKLR